MTISLDCWYCGREFPDFAPLAEHVKKVHGTNAFEWKKGGTRPNRAPQQGESMLPAYTDDDSGVKGRRNKSRTGVPFLTSEDLSKSPKEGKILGVRHDPENKFGPAVLVKLALDGKAFMWTLRVKKNPNLQLLIGKFGRDENDWVGQKIRLYLELDEFSEQYFPRVQFTDEKSNSKR